MKEYLLTDFARFGASHIVSIAVVDPESGECFRPLPCLTAQHCEEYNIRPGAKITGEFKPASKTVWPHVEDANHRNLKFVGIASPEEFQAVLEKTVSSSVSEGFEIELKAGQTRIMEDDFPSRSIITLKVAPGQAFVHEDVCNPNRVKMSITDMSGQSFQALEINDRNFRDLAERKLRDFDLDQLQQKLAKQDAIYLRIGLTPPQLFSDGKRAFQLEVTGVYTFPDFPLGGTELN